MTKRRLFILLTALISISYLSASPADGIKYFNMAKESYADKNYKKAFDNFYRASVENHVEASYYVGWCYENGLGTNQDFSRAANFYQKAAKSKHIQSLLQLGSLYRTGKGIEQDYNKALDCFTKVLDSYRSRSGDYDDKVSEMYNKIADVYVGLENYETAISYYNKSLTIITKLHGDKNENAYSVFKNIGVIYLQKKDYENANLYLNRALLILETIKSASIDEKAFIYDKVGELHEAQGAYEEARKNYETAMTFYVAAATLKEPESTLSAGSEDTDESADDNFLEPDLDSLDVAREYVNIARLYYYYDGIDAMEKAISNAKNGLTMIQKVSKEHTPQEAEACNLLAKIYDKMNYYPQAIETYKQAREINKSVYGPKHQEVAFTDSNLGILYSQQMKDFRNAKVYFTELFEIYETYLATTQYADFGSILENLWDLVTNWQPVTVNKSLSKDYGLMHERLFDIAMRTTDKIRESNFSTSHRNDILPKIIPFYYLGVGYYNYKKDYEKVLHYTELLKTEGLLSNIGFQNLDSIAELTESERQTIKRIFAENQQYTVNIYLQTIKPVKERDNASILNMNTKIMDNRRELQNLEKKLKKTAPKYFLYKNIPTITIAQAKTWCKNDNAVLNYVLWDKSFEKAILMDERFEIKRLNLHDHVMRAYQEEVKKARTSYDYRSKKAKGETPNLPPAPSKLALESFCVVVNTFGINVIRLGDNIEFEKEMREIRKLLTERRNPDDKEFTDLKKYFYSKLIKPIEDYLPVDGAELLVVPDGSLAYLPFDILGDGDLPDLGERFNIALSPSLSITARKDPAGVKSSWKVLAVGNAIYDRLKRGNNRGIFSQTVSAPKTDSEELEKIAHMETAGAYYKKREITWNNLPGTKYEIRDIQDKYFPNNSSLLEGINASEQTIKWLSQEKQLKDYSIVHFACNSFYDNAYPNMTSLVLSDSSDANPAKTQDGYLTVREIAALNMNAEFTVITASQSDFPELENGKSLSGLAQGFFLAGSKTLGLSLWNVDDETTYKFFEKLYQKIKSKDFQSGEMTWAKAFREAKEDLKKERDWINPYYWSGFVLFE